MEDLSHDSVNRFLLRERYEPKDLFDEVKLHINFSKPQSFENERKNRGFSHRESVSKHHW